MLAGILLHIIKLKTVYSYESDHSGGSNQSLTSCASSLPISRNRPVKLGFFRAKIPKYNFLIGNGSGKSGE